MATLDAYTNLPYSKVFAAPSPATTGTSLSLSGGTGGRLPAVPFNATVWPLTDYPDPTNTEIVRVTAKAGDVLTIVRAQEGTTARTILVGDAFAAVITKKFIDDMRDASNMNSGTLPVARLPADVALVSTLGEVHDVPYNANLFSATPGITWTVTEANYVSYWYSLLGKICVVGVNLGGYTISGSVVPAGALYIKLPAGIVASRSSWGGAGVTAPVSESVRVGINIDQDKIFCQKNDGSAWTIGAGQFLYFHLIFPMV